MSAGENLCSGRKCDDYWLEVSGLMAKLDVAGRHGQSSLIKIDGLREVGKTYTVLLGGPLNEGPIFRRNSDELLAALKDAVSLVNDPRTDHAPPSWPLNEVATLLCEADVSARAGVFIAVRIDAPKEGVLYEVSLGGPLIRDAYFDASGGELALLLREAMAFYVHHTGYV